MDIPGRASPIYKKSNKKEESYLREVGEGGRMSRSGWTESVISNPLTPPSISLPERDITELKVTSFLASKAAEGSFRSMTSSGSRGVVAFDCDGRVETAVADGNGVAAWLAGDSEVLYAPSVACTSSLLLVTSGNWVASSPLLAVFSSFSSPVDDDGPLKGTLTTALAAIIRVE